MLRTSEERSARGDSSSPEQTQVQFASHVEDMDGHEPSRAHITELERAQIWAALSKETSKTSSIHDGGHALRKYGSGAGDRSAIQHPEKSAKMPRDSKTKKFGKAFKRLFMNDQTVDHERIRNRRDSWDDLYRNKDAAKIRPIHEEYGVL